MKSLLLSFVLALALVGNEALTADALSGSLTSVGSDTASALLARWAAAFHAAHAQARIQIQAAGSASAPIALIEGAADFGSMSRPMSAQEMRAFDSRYGYAATQLIVARDAIAVFVHPQNPLSQITLGQLDAIYSATRRCGAPRAILAWRDFGADASGAFAASSILPVGRNAGSGTYEMFRELALCNGEYRAQVIAWPGNGAIVATAATNREAIGYAGIGYVNGRVKPLAIAREEGEPAITPDLANITSGRYPLARALYVYVNRAPGQVLARLPTAFLAYALSDEGQALVRQEGFVPLTATELAAQRAILQ